MTLLTCMEIESNYPENILIDAGQDKETQKWASMMYMMRDGRIHKLMVTYDPIFESEQQAIDAMVDVRDKAIQYLKEYRDKKAKEDEGEV